VFSNVAPFSHPDVEVAYDNFRVNSGSFACPSWWTDNAPNWQAIPDQGKDNDDEDSGDD
jgi:hypothetical protein